MKSKYRHIIIGASGVIGSELLENLNNKKEEVIPTFSSKPIDGGVKFDMRTSSLSDVVGDLSNNDIVYLLAAYSNPSWIFAHQDEANELNIVATKKLIDELSVKDCRIVFMSSVEIFDGETGAYSEKSEPNPLNLYGKMKLEIENYLEEKSNNFCVVRTAWNVGWSQVGRCVIQLTYQTLLKENAKMAHDNCFSIIDAKDTAEGLYRIGVNDDVNVCHLVGGEHIFRTDLADRVVRYSNNGHKMSYSECSFSDIPYSEKRALKNDMDGSFSVRRLEMEYKSLDDVIKRKVAYLDSLVKDGILNI